MKRRDLAYDDLIFPKTPEKLPVVLSQEEVKRLIEAAPNLLHRTLLMVLYSTGVRRKEASLLKVSDIDSQRQVLLATARRIRSVSRCRKHVPTGVADSDDAPDECAEGDPTRDQRHGTCAWLHSSTVCRSNRSCDGQHGSTTPKEG